MARREAAWDRLEKAYAAEERVDGAIFGRVKGGFTVDLGGAVGARLPLGPFALAGGAVAVRTLTLEVDLAIPAAVTEISSKAKPSWSR